MSKPHPTLHVFFPGPTPVLAAQTLLKLNPTLAPVNLATCIQHYQWVLKPKEVPLCYRGHPEIALWSRHYVALAAFGHAQALLLSACAITPEQRGYFSTALKALDRIRPLRQRPVAQTQPKFLQVDTRIALDELSVRVLAKDPELPVMGVFPLYPIKPETK